jgi:hypothetical protein
MKTQIVGVIHKCPPFALLVFLSTTERYQFLKNIGDRLGMHSHVIVFVSSVMLVLCIVYAHNPSFFFQFSFCILSTDCLYTGLPLPAAKAVAVGMILG